DLPHRRGEAPLALVLLDHLEDLALARGEGGVGHGGTSVDVQVFGTVPPGRPRCKHPFAAQAFDPGLDGERLFGAPCEQPFPNRRSRGTLSHHSAPPPTLDGDALPASLSHLARRMAGMPTAALTPAALAGSPALRLLPTTVPPGPG